MKVPVSLQYKLSTSKPFGLRFSYLIGTSTTSPPSWSTLVGVSSTTRFTIFGYFFESHLNNAGTPYASARARTDVRLTCHGVSLSFTLSAPGVRRFCVCVDGRSMGGTKKESAARKAEKGTRYYRVTSLDERETRSEAAEYEPARLRTEQASCHRKQGHWMLEAGGKYAQEHVILVLSRCSRYQAAYSRVACGGPRSNPSGVSTSTPRPIGTNAPACA